MVHRKKKHGFLTFVLIVLACLAVFKLVPAQRGALNAAVGPLAAAVTTPDSSASPRASSSKPDPSKSPTLSLNPDPGIQQRRFAHFFGEDFAPVSLGDRGGAVFTVQERLIALGYLEGAADGIFGPATEAAVRSFQAANRLNATGQASRATCELLAALPSTVVTPTPKPSFSPESSPAYLARQATKKPSPPPDPYATIETQTAAVSPTERTSHYVINKNTGKFHESYCPSADQIKAKNRIDFYGTRKQVIAQGYVPCKRCNP